MSQESVAPRAGLKLAALIFVQMLPATLVAPAIRPLFSAFHHNAEGAMHAFMSVNMLAAVLAAPLVARCGQRMKEPRHLLAALAMLDSLLLTACALPLPTSLLLLVRAAEGATHVGGATLLLAEAAALSRSSEQTRVMGITGGAIMFAIALGSLLGGALATLDPRLPFLTGGWLLAGIAWLAVRSESSASIVGDGPKWEPRVARARWLVPITAAFVGRFTVGCLVVTFALFVHRVHGLSPAATGVLFTSMTLPFALAVYPAARLGERISRGTLLGAGAIGYAASLVALGWAPVPLLPVLMGFAGVGSAMMFATVLCYASAFPNPDDRSTAMGWVNAAGCFGMVIGPLVAGLIMALARDPHDPARAPRLVFLVAATTLLVWFAGVTVMRREKSTVRLYTKVLNDTVS